MACPWSCACDPPPPLIKVASNTRPYSKLGGTTLNGREEGGQYRISQTYDQERFEARKVVFSLECLNIFATGCSLMISPSLQLFGILSYCHIFINWCTFSVKNSMFASSISVVTEPWLPVATFVAYLGQLHCQWFSRRFGGKALFAVVLTQYRCSRRSKSANLETFRFWHEYDYEYEVFSILNTAWGWSSVILAGKHDCACHSTTSFSGNGSLQAEVSHDQAKMRERRGLSSFSHFSRTFTHPFTLFYHIWLNTLSKETWTEEVRNA